MPSWNSKGCGASWKIEAITAPRRRTQGCELQKQDQVPPHSSTGVHHPGQQTSETSEVEQESGECLSMQRKLFMRCVR